MIRRYDEQILFENRYRFLVQPQGVTVLLLPSPPEYLCQYMGHQNALEFLRVDFVYPTGSLFCDLSRHAVFRDALTIG